MNGQPSRSAETPLARAGRADPERDVKAGHLALEVFAVYPDSARVEFDSTALAQHGIALRQVANGINPVDQGVRRHAWAYNKVVEAEIERRFGADVAKAADAALKHYFYSGPF